MTIASHEEPRRASGAGGRDLRQRWERVGAVAGIAAAVLLVANLIALSGSPSVGSSAQEVVDHLEINNTVTLVTSYLGAVICVLLLPFMASLRTFVHDHPEEAEWRWTVTLLSGALALAAVLVGSAMYGAAAVLADHTEPAVLSALFTVAKLVHTFSLVPIAAMVVANARTMSTSPTPVGWLVRLGAGIGILSFLSTTAIFFVDDDWFGPGEPVVAMMGFLLSMWLVATAVTILQGEPAAAAH